MILDVPHRVGGRSALLLYLPYEFFLGGDGGEGGAGGAPTEVVADLLRLMPDR